jgi:N5-(cytidine 5'-diphosphoramidyl)-L-glutamine hydrolase
MKKIGITQRLDSIKEYDEIRCSLDIKWEELLKVVNIVSVTLPINFNSKLINDLEISGIILTGGNDLSSQSDNKLSNLRDKNEYLCVEYAIKNSLPVFGVCRGMQFLAEYFGSTLNKIENHISSRHNIKVLQETKYSSKLVNIENVNSYHNFSIDKLGDDLEALAICTDDNTIEAIEHRKYKIFGHMWHPEREEPFNKYNIELIRDFFYQ